MEVGGILLTLLVLCQQPPDIGEEASLWRRGLLSFGNVRLVLQVVCRT